jgi:Holliday junction resolvase RusA-like endonuclease
MSAHEPLSTPPARMSADEFRALAAARHSSKPAPRRQTRVAAPRKDMWARVGGSVGPYRLALPFLPPSVNQLFSSVRCPETGTIKRVLTRKARRVRKLIVAMISGSLDASRLYELRIDVYLSAWTKTGRVRKVDLTNRVKFLEDCVCTALGIDDSHVFRVVLQKHDSEQERTVLEIRELKPPTKQGAP